MFDALRAAREDEIASGKKLATQSEAEFAELMEKQAVAFDGLAEMHKDLVLDRTFLKN